MEKTRVQGKFLLGGTKNTDMEKIQVQGEFLLGGTKNMDEDLPRTFVDASHLLRSRLPPRTSMRLYSLGLEVLVKFTREKLTMEQPK